MASAADRGCDVQGGALNSEMHVSRRYFPSCGFIAVDHRSTSYWNNEQIVLVYNFVDIENCYWRQNRLFNANDTLPYLTFGVGRLLHLPSAEAVSVRPNAQPRCNQKVTVIGCEAKQITSHLGLVTCSMVVPIRRSALG